MITFSAPGKVHLLGEHTVVYGKPALLVTIDLRIAVTLSSSYVIPNKVRNLPSSEDLSLIARDDKRDTIQIDNIKKIIEPIIKKYLSIKTIPSYQLEIASQLPIGAGLGSSAAISAAYIAALLSFLKVKWDKTLVNDLTYEAEKAFHGNPSGGDNSIVVFGGLVWYRKETPDLKIIQPLPFSIPSKLAKNFILINTGKPKETTREMVELVKSKIKNQKSKVRKIFDSQEKLVRELVTAIKEGNENKLIQIIKLGEKNLENLGVVSSFAKSIIRKIEQAGGAAKICGGGGKIREVGILLAYHQDSKQIEKIANSLNLPFFRTALGVKGLRQEGQS